jgi:hypothetical protein
MDESRDSLRVLSIGESFKEAVSGAQNGKSHLSWVNQGREAFMMALAGFAEEHSLNAATGAEGLFNETWAFDTDEAVFGSQAPAESHAKFLEPTILAAGQERRVTSGARTASDFSGRGHHVEGSKFSIVEANPERHSAWIHSFRVASRRFLYDRQTMTINPALPNKKIVKYAMSAIFRVGYFCSTASISKPMFGCALNSCD